MRKLLSITLLGAAAVFAQVSAPLPAQDPKTFYTNLPTAQPTQASFEQAVSAANQIAALSKTQAQELVPIIFAAIQGDTEGTKHAALGLYAMARRPDSGEIMKPFLKNIAALLTNTDPALKATAGHILLNMHPQPPEAADILLGFINGPTGKTNEKIDALTALRDLQNPPKDKLDAAVIQILKRPMDAPTMSAAINAAAYPGGSDAKVDAVAVQLAHADWQVLMRAAFAIRVAGPRAIARHRAELAKLANDQTQPEAVRTITQNTLDGKDEKCVSLQTSPTPQFVPIPGCKPH
jgi:hypothetical protein